MGFWGLEVKPGKPQTFHPKNEQGKLHLTQATLGSGSGKEKSVIQCSVAGNTPIYLCSLLPNKTECCPLNLEFEDDDETVEFSVTGDRSIHLTGFLEEYDDEEEMYEQDEDDSDAMDVAAMGSEESSDYDSEDDEDEDEMDQFEDFLDRNLEMYRQASVPNSGVVIEEIEDEEKPVEDKKAKRSKKKSQATKDENANKQIVVKESAADVPVLESEDEDEDGFPLPKENKSGDKINSDVDEQGSNKKRKAKASEQDNGVEESANKNKKKKNQKEKKKEESVSVAEAETVNVLKKKENTQTSSNQKAQNGTVNSAIGSSKTPDKSAEKKNKKQKKNTNEEATVEKPSSASAQRKQVNSKAPQEQTYPSGLVVEELKLGKPNGKQATPGKQVLVRYIGKLQKNGKIFDSNIGKAPFKFKLGRGEVIQGWDVGVNGMRVGEKRKLTIPPSLGYGPRGAGAQIPPNAWLSFEVELIDVK